METYRTAPDVISSPLACMAHAEGEEAPHPAKDAPEQHGEIPRTRDGSEDHKKDPWKDPGK